MDEVIAKLVSLGTEKEIAQKATEATKSLDIELNQQWIEKYYDDLAI